MMPLSNSRVHVARWMETLAGAVASVLFPSGCRICQALLTRADRLPVCDTCLKSFRRLPGQVCELCGQPWTEGGDVDGDENVCRECRERRFAFDAAWSFGVYGGALARAIVLMKYERIEPLGTWFAKRLQEAAKRISRSVCPRLIVPVPLDRTRQRERGFNQVDLFGLALAKRLERPYGRYCSSGNAPGRTSISFILKNVGGPYMALLSYGEGGRVDNLRILLLDDVMTSGATLDACSRALRERGAKSVAGLSIARAVRRGIPVRESI